MAARLDDFMQIEKIGQGAFGKVYAVKKLRGSDAGSTYAAKVMYKSSINLQEAKREILILKQCAHPFVLNLAYEFETKMKFYIFMEEMQCTLLDILKYLQNFTEEEARYFLIEIITGVGYLHENRIVHRDLKPDNILLSSLGHIKIADFGLAVMDYDNRQVCYGIFGSYNYMAPEMVMRMGYGKAVDWWAVGVLTYQFLTGSMPFYADNNDKIIENIINRDYPALPSELSDDSKGLVGRFLTLVPDERLGYNGAEEIMQHKFFNIPDWKTTSFYSVELPSRIRTYLFGECEIETSPPTNTVKSSTSRLKKMLKKYFCYCSIKY